jgi:hypothetical protein
MELTEEFIQFEDGSHVVIGATNYDKSKPRKFQTLTFDGYYKIIGYTPAFNNSYILLIKDIKSNEEFEMYSTNKLTECINDPKFYKTDGIYFYVKQDSSLQMKYPEIQGYKVKFEENKPKRQFTMF